VSIENAKKINDLMTRLGKSRIRMKILELFFFSFSKGSTHLQVDEYSRRRTEEISEAVSESIRKVVAETQQHQQQLLADANSRTAGIDLLASPPQLLSIKLLLFYLAIENDFKIRIQEYVAKLDVEKASLLAQLEQELNIRQERILESARQRIDNLNEEANRLKMVNSFFYSIVKLSFFFQGVLREAQAQSNAKISNYSYFLIPYIYFSLIIDQITEQVVALGQEDASRRLASTTTTVIKFPIYIIFSILFSGYYNQSSCYK
jgi:hypothetical protein